jgi:hypothetical protein
MGKVSKWLKIKNAKIRNTGRGNSPKNVSTCRGSLKKNIFFVHNLFVFSRLPYWVQAIIPKIFYVTEKAWNYYPFTITDYTVSVHS